MDEKVAGKVKAFVDSTNNLFSEIESWIAQTKLKGTRQETNISEEASGEYKDHRLTLTDEGGKMIAELVPVGTFIIGGNGRIDLKGTIDKAIIVNLGVGGPSMTTTITVRDQAETRTNRF